MHSIMHCLTSKCLGIGGKPELFRGTHYTACNGISAVQKAVKLEFTTYTLKSKQANISYNTVNELSPYTGVHVNSCCAMPIIDSVCHGIMHGFVP